jgi:hypothetical protein
MADAKKVVVEFTKGLSPYVKGDVATFTEDEVEALKEQAEAANRKDAIKVRGAAKAEKPAQTEAPKDNK